MSKVGCIRKDGINICPISKMVCPGVCIYSEIMENIQIGIIVLDTEGRSVIFQNQLASDLLRDSVRPRDYESLCYLLLPNMEDFIASPSPITKSLKSGNRLLGYTSYSIIRGFLWIFIEDITEKERLLSIAEAAETMNNLGYIFSGMRHEIGNPLNSMKMTMSVLRKNLKNFSEEIIYEYVERVQSEINRMDYLLQSLKNFNMIEKPKLQEVDIASFLDKFLLLTENDFLKKGIRLRVKWDYDSGSGFIDPRALQQVLLNLMTNAADALEYADNPEIVITVNRLPGIIQMSIEDNGCGMSAEQMKNLFKPFNTTKAKGTGLGLVIAKKMLAKMNCTIEVESYENIGTKVTITLPECSGRIS